MERRNFLKGVIGFVAGTQVPWVAQRPVYKTATQDNLVAHRLRALHLPKQVLERFKAACVLESGQKIWAPMVKMVTVKYTEFGHCSLVDWAFVEIDLKQAVKINTVRLIDDLGVLVMERCLSSPVYGMPGDTIRLVSVAIRCD